MDVTRNHSELWWRKHAKIAFLFPISYFSCVPRARIEDRLFGPQNLLHSLQHLRVIRRRRRNHALVLS